MGSDRQRGGNQGSKNLLPVQEVIHCRSMASGLASVTIRTLLCCSLADCVGPDPEMGAAGVVRDASRFAYSLVLLLRLACCSFWMSAGESCGRSMGSVILSILPVNLNGTW